MKKIIDFINHCDVYRSKLRELWFNYVLAFRELFGLSKRAINYSDIVFLYHPQKLPLSQCYPFHFYKKEIKRAYKKNLCLCNFLKFSFSGDITYENVSYVFLQTWFNLTQDEINNIVKGIKATFPNAKLVYFDWFAPTNLRMGSFLGNDVYKYVKKNLLKDFSQYNKPTYGDTNLANYYNSLLNLGQEKFHFQLPEAFNHKVVVAPGFITSPFMMNQALSSGGSMTIKTMDVCSRLGGTRESGWYGEMRRFANGKINELSDKYSIGNSGNLKFSQYFKELRESKITFSPFGYGEVCWRDYEAMLSGSLLLKPRMDHMFSEPDIFVEYETYIPLEWDFSDLDEKIERYINDDKERERICSNARRVLSSYVKNANFLSFFEKLL